MLLSHEDVYPFLLLIALANCVHILSKCLKSKNGVLYSEGRAYKRAPELVASPQLTALHSTGNISAEDSVYKNEVDMWNSKPFVIFPAEITAAHSLHFQPLHVD